MKKLFILLQVVIMLCTFVACGGIPPFSQPLTKWQGDGFELYVNEQGNGHILYKASKEETVFDAEFIYGHLLCIYKHRDSAEQDLELVVQYFPDGINTESRYKFGSRDLNDQEYSNIFPETIVFEKQCDITTDDIKYDFIEITSQEGYKARGEEEYTNRLNSDGELEPESEADSPTIIVKEKREDGTISWWEKTSRG